MPLYRTSKKESFITSVSDFILNNFRDNLADIKVILPNGYLCNYLQKIIVDKIGATILPSVIPISNITSEKEETFKIPSDQIGKITALEERMILAEIIHSYTPLEYDLAGSLALSSSLAKLFFEFEANSVDLNILKNIPTGELAEHWHFIYDFLEFAYLNWQQKIIDTKKLSPAHHQKLMLNAHLNRVGDTCATIIAGVIGNNQVTQDFITKVALLQNGHVILPPLPDCDLGLLKLKAEDPLYNLAKLIKPICKKFLNLPLLDVPTPAVLDGLLVEGNFNRHCEEPALESQEAGVMHVVPSGIAALPSEARNDEQAISFLEFDHILHEAEYVALECARDIAKNPDAKIAILITNDKTKNYFTAKLVKYGLEFSDQIGDNILTLQATTLILEIAENICKSFSLKDFISLISHPLVMNDETIKLKKLIAKKNRFAQNIEEVIRHCEPSQMARQSQEGRRALLPTPEIASSHCVVPRNDDTPHRNDDDLENLLTLCSSLRITNYNFHAILRQIIDIAKMLCPALWHDPARQKIAEALEEVLNTPWTIKSLDAHNLETLPEIIKSLLAGGRVVSSKGQANITICSPNDVTLMNYDLLIYTNFVENSYPLPQFNSPWLNNQMAEQVGLDSEPARFGNTMYDFYLNLHNEKVLITRSIKTGDSGVSLPSPFMFRLKHVLGTSTSLRGTSASCDEAIPGETTNRHCDEREARGGNSRREDGDYSRPAEIATASSRPRNDDSLPYHHIIPFPLKISVTDIETLIRAPYNFYAKKILNLRPLQEIEDNPKLSEFGNFFHKIVELYTNDGSHSLEDYAKKLLAGSIFPKQTQKFWQFKIESLAKDFIAFDNDRRSRSLKIYTEVRGEMELVIPTRHPQDDDYTTKVKIVAIADRIEITEQNKAYILDYKTGAIPTKGDVLSGLSPQLMIEAMILLEGGFVDIGKDIETESIIYVKINSSAPFISTTEIKITRTDILEHKEKLIQLLTHYIEVGEYPTEPNLMKYDDYWHLGRRE